MNLNQFKLVCIFTKLIYVYTWIKTLQKCVIYAENKQLGEQELGLMGLQKWHVDLVKDDFLNKSLPTVSSLPVQLFLSTSCNLVLLNYLDYILLGQTTPNLDPFAQILQLFLVYVLQLRTYLSDNINDEDIQLLPSLMNRRTRGLHFPIVWREECWTLCWTKKSKIAFLMKIEIFCFTLFSFIPFDFLSSIIFLVLAACFSFSLLSFSAFVFSFGSLFTWRLPKHIDENKSGGKTSLVVSTAIFAWALCISLVARAKLASSSFSCWACETDSCSLIMPSQILIDHPSIMSNRNQCWKYCATILWYSESMIMKFHVKYQTSKGPRFSAKALKPVCTEDQRPEGSWRLELYELKDQIFWRNLHNMKM